MQKLKKLSKNKKPIVVFIYGPMAVGKLTVAKILAKRLGFKLAHNHHVNDFVREIFDQGTQGSTEMKEFLRYYLLTTIVKNKVNVVTTHAYAHDFVSSSGLSDPKYVETLAKNITKQGGLFYPVHLKASYKTLLERVNNSSRKKFFKIVTKKLLREVHKNRDWENSPNIKNNFIIKNDHVSPSKAVDMIIEHFKLHAFKS